MDTTTHKIKLDTLLELTTAELQDLAVYTEVSDDWQIKTAAVSEADESLQADAFEGADMNVAELAELELQYHNIKHALQKIAAGTYGSCEICTAPIEADRLSVNPAARTCREHMDREPELPL